MANDPKDTLHKYLQTARDVMVWKLEGVSDYDIRRPMTQTGTNLLGLVKHLAYVEAGYFGWCCNRPFRDMSLWDDDEPNSDLWAKENETREHIIETYRKVWAHSDATITELPLDAPAHVRWWPPERADTTLNVLLIHVIAETHRHAGHADILRETIDGAVGHRVGFDNLPPDVDEAWWENYRARLEDVATQFRTP